MSTATRSTTMTLEEMLALPDDGLDRELIRGKLREKPMTRRNRWHSTVESRLTRFLGDWLETQPKPRGEIVSGEAGFVLGKNPDSGVGIDIAYVSAEVYGRNTESVYFDGPPILAVEILSPSDKQSEIDEKVKLYLDSGVAVVWIINPTFRTVIAYRPSALPEFFNLRQELSAEPHLPGFRVPVAELFPE